MPPQPSPSPSPLRSENKAFIQGSNEELNTSLRIFGSLDSEICSWKLSAVGLSLDV